MAKTKTSTYDAANYLDTPARQALYLEACIEEGDAAFVAEALGDIARARGMAQVAQDAGLGRESLYKTLSGKRVPTFATILKVMSALGLQLSVTAAPTTLPDSVAEPGERG